MAASTNSRDDFDVAIIGGGPAGSTAAIATLQRNPRLRVALVDKSQFPRDKSCGDGLGPGVVRVLNRIDALDLVNEESSPNAVRVVGPDGIVGSAEGPTIAGRDLRGFVVRRSVFDARLRQRALELGAEPITGSFLSMAVDNASRRLQVRTSRYETAELSASLVVGADGAYSKVRSQLGIPRPSDRHRHIAMRAYCTLDMGTDSAALQLEFTRQLLPAYGWVFPLRNGEANIGVGVPLTILKRRKLNLESMTHSFADSLRARGYRVGELEGLRAHHLPHSAGLEKMAHDRAFIIGDAAGTINALSGEGIYYGMRAGQELGTAIADVSLANREVLNQTLTQVESRYKKSLKPHLRSSLMAHRMLRSSLWARLVVGAAAADPRVMEAAALMLFDDGRITPEATARILRHGFSRTFWSPQH